MRLSPSMAEVGEEVRLSALECDLDEGSDKELAHAWAKSIVKSAHSYYVAYRAGNDKVEVCERRDSTVLRIHRIKVVN
jgi:hypothetical protein